MSSQQWIEPGQPQPQAGDVVQAGFLRRWAALFLDQLVLGAAFYALLFVLVIVIGMVGGFDQLERIDSNDPPGWVIAAYLGVTLLYYAAAGLYFSLMESSANQATLGKMALGIKVVDARGARLSFAHALGRWFAASLSYLTLYIGFLLAAFTQRKQALHDLVAGTFVVDKWAYTDRPELQQRGLGGCVIAFAIAMGLLLAGTLLAILAAVAIPAYQQYAERAQFQQVIVPVDALRTRVQEAVDASGRCPDNASPGFLAPDAYAAAGINRIVIGEFEEGFCGISAWMPPLHGTVERQFLAELDPDDGTWYCSGALDEKTLPGWCR